jgi:hypothetical protein
MPWDGGTLDSLHGVSQHLISKLQGAGIQSISDLAVTTTSELLEDYYTNYDESVNAITLLTLLLVVALVHLQNQLVLVANPHMNLDMIMDAMTPG